MGPHPQMARQRTHEPRFDWLTRLPFLDCPSTTVLRIRSFWALIYLLYRGLTHVMRVRISIASSAFD